MFEMSFSVMDSIKFFFFSFSLKQKSAVGLRRRETRGKSEAELNFFFSKFCKDGKSWLKRE